MGTHTHDATAYAHLLPNSTGFVAELGMTGRLGFSGYGFDPVHFIHAYRGERVDDLPPFELATGPLTLGAAVFTIKNGLTTSVQRLLTTDLPSHQFA